MKVVSPSPPQIADSREGWASYGGHRMRYLRAGSGPPILLIHGLLGYSFSWRFNLCSLGAIREIFAPDLLGTGFSERASDLDCSVRASAGRMLQFMRRVGAEQFDLLGTSHGGGVAVMMAALAPERIRRLVLVAPVNPWSKHGQWITRVLATSLGRAGMRAALPAIVGLGPFWLARMYGNPGRIAPGTIDGYMAPFSLDGTWDYALNIVSCWREDLQQLAQSYSRIFSPTLLIWGDQDPAVAIASAEEIVRRIPQARLTVFRGAGHLPYEEVPEDFNHALHEFLP